MITKSEIIDTLKKIKPFLSQEYAVKEIGLFGSFSDNSFTDESDIDILVELENPIGWKFFTLEKYLENIFNRKIDLVTPNALKEPMKEQIFSQIMYVR